MQTDPFPKADDAPQRVTELIHAAARGEPLASQRLFGLLYAELRDLAVLKMRTERANHTLQPTALVHEAYLRLLRDQSLSCENRAHFFGAAAESMRRILIESVRSKRRLKRGGEVAQVELRDSEIGAESSIHLDQVLDLNDAVSALEKEDPELAKIVKLRFFGGQSMESIAEMLGVSLSTIERRWRFARAWLADWLGERNSTESK